MKQTLTIPETFLGVGYTKNRAGLPLEAVGVPVPRPEADQVLIRVAASSLNPLEYKLAELNFFGRTPPSSSASTWNAAAGGFPAMQGNEAFLMKDVVLFAVSFYLLKQDLARVALPAGSAKPSAN